MTAEQCKAIARRYFEDLMTEGNLAVADEILPAQVMTKGGASSRETFKQLAMLLRGAFPDWRNTLEAQYADGDIVVTRVTSRGTHQGPYLGVPATGKQVTRGGIFIFRIEDGRIVEIWDEIDQLGLFRQLGTFPALS